MSHRLVTVLVTDGDVRSLQTALWHGKPSVVLPTSPDQVRREADIGVNVLGTYACVSASHGAPLRCIAFSVALCQCDRHEKYLGWALRLDLTVMSVEAEIGPLDKRGFCTMGTRI